MTLWSRDLVRSRNKLKPLYFHYPSAYGHETWQNDDFAWWAPTYNVTWPLITWPCEKWGWLKEEGPAYKWLNLHQLPVVFTYNFSITRLKNRVKHAWGSFFWKNILLNKISSFWKLKFLLLKCFMKALENSLYHVSITQFRFHVVRKFVLNGALVSI